MLGYTVDSNNNIITGDNGKILFKEEELIDGDIPPIHLIQGINFSPFEILGDVEFMEDGKAITDEES